jgi:sulfur carrier protein
MTEATICVNGQDEPLSAATLAAFITERDITPEGRGIAVAHNGALVRRADWAQTRLAPGDQIEIVLAKQGG